MAAQAVRLIGLVILVLELHRRRGLNTEFYCLCVALVIGLCECTRRDVAQILNIPPFLAFVLAFTATNTGAIVLVKTLNLAMCSRQM